MSGSLRHPRGDQRQHVIDPGHRCNYSQVPHLLLDDTAAGVLHPAAVVLLLHYMRAAFEQHGAIDETLRETGKRTGLSNGTLLKARDELANAGWLTVEKQGNRSGQDVTITLAERWEDNCKCHGQHLGQKMTKSEDLGRKPAKFGQKPAKFGRNLTKPHLSELPFNTEDIKDPFGDGGVDSRVTGLERQLPGMLTEVPPSRSFGATSGPIECSYTAEELLDGLYRDGLQSKPARDARELDSARDLAADGATPADAAAWAREAVADGQIKIVTATTFLKAWPGWRARRHRHTVVVDRSGYEHDPWQGQRPPIAAADLARGAVL